MASRTTVERAMLRAPLLIGCSPDAVRDLIDRSRVHEYRRGTYLFHQGDDAPEVFFLSDGRVEISSTSITGHRQLHTMLEPPQFFGELGVLGEIKRTTTAIALEDTTATVIPGEAFLGFLARHPQAARSILRALARQIASHEDLIEDLLFLDLRGRLAKRLIGLVSPSFDELPTEGAVIPSDVTHADLASLSGGSRENVTRILSEFQRRGFVERTGKRYTLTDIESLRRLAGL